MVHMCQERLLGSHSIVIVQQQSLKVDSAEKVGFWYTR